MVATTSEGYRSAVPEAALEELRAEIRGQTLPSPEPGPTGVRETFNAMHQGQPEIAVSCSGTADVVAAVRFARERGLPIAVRGGGHSIAGLSAIEGGVLIDLAPMRGVQVDPERRLAHVQGGALIGDVDRETQAFGLATPLGVVSETGVGGLTLGGGYGWLRRKYGLASDNVVEAQVVCADGEVRTASAERNPDLFFAIRGGGGNFGIVTSLTYRLHPVGPTVAFAGTLYPIEEYGSILRGFRDITAGAPNEITSVCVTMTFPADPHMPPEVHDRPVCIVGAVHCGADIDAGMAALQPWRELGTVLADISGPTPFVGVQTSFDPLFPRQQLHCYWKSQYVDELSDGLCDVLHRYAQDRPGPMSLVNLFAMGGRLAEIDPEETAFSARKSPYMVSIDGMWGDASTTPDGVAWVRACFDEVSRYGNGAVYLNFTGRDDEPATAGVDSAYGRNLRRLAEVKAKYDPDNFFRANQNILPA